ncbi:MAG: beta-galactosidase GalB, partial [Christiangramia sp.]
MSSKFPFDTFRLSGLVILCIFSFLIAEKGTAQNKQADAVRQRISLNKDWKFFKYETNEQADKLIYEARPAVEDVRDDKPADSKPTEAVTTQASEHQLKAWILPSGNDFLKDSEGKFKRPEGNPGVDFPFVQPGFQDENWEKVNVPHDWAIPGPFMEGWDAEVGGGMGRLPSPGVAWYRKKINLTQTDLKGSIFLDIDGAMSYAMVWLNGKLVGGWPYGYSSWRLDLSPYAREGENQIAIRLDNPNYSSRWYPGGGIYRNVWLVKTNKIHVAHWGSFVRTEEVTRNSAKLKLDIQIENDSEHAENIQVSTQIFEWNDGVAEADPVAEIPVISRKIEAHSTQEFSETITITKPKLWGPLPQQRPNRYLARTIVQKNSEKVDVYETNFGIRSVEFDATNGLLVNGEKIYIQGVNQHHDLGALGAAFNKSAARRQLLKLREMGVNAIRMAHNPPAPELLQLTDEMGFLVVDEIFDGWQRKKNPHDFHLIFNDWYRQDIRSWIRRDRNHPSIILWSIGNEVGEQYTGEEGAQLAHKLRALANEEDPTRPTSASMNYAKPDMPFSAEMEVLNLNYQGEGIRNAPAYAHFDGIKTPPLYPDFQQKFPKKAIISSENAAALSSRGTYIFPVSEGISAPVSDTTGGDPIHRYVSSYELYTAPFGSSADKVFKSLDQHPFVAGGFVWSGWDYLGEPTPYYLSRSSYYGIIDLAGFKKDRFYLYQARWRPDFPMAHILPHWNFPERKGELTPVHIFTSGDEAELFLNGKSLGKKKKAEYEYRLRWDSVRYEPGELTVIAYKNGQKWAEDTVRTAGKAVKLIIKPEKESVQFEEEELGFLAVKVLDAKENPVPTAANLITFSVEGPAEIVATDNGDPTDMTAFPSKSRKAFSGKALVIIRP